MTKRERNKLFAPLADYIQLFDGYGKPRIDFRTMYQLFPEFTFSAINVVYTKRVIKKMARLLTYYIKDVLVMTYKSIVENMVEIKARQALEKCTGKDFSFGEVELLEKPNKKSLFMDFFVTMKELGKPWNYEVLVSISDIGIVSANHYRIQDNNIKTWIHF